VELDFAVLADSVEARPDGKLDILGAGFDTVFASAVPARHPRLILALRILLSRTDTEAPHRLDVLIQAADGTELARAHADFSTATDAPYARSQMAMRGIERDDVELVLADPEADFPSREPPYRHIYSRHIGARLLYVLVESFDHDCVVNAFWPSPQGRRP
jgi:hypothetical protein